MTTNFNPHRHRHELARCRAGAAAGRGVTLMEVIFAIGVILTGLVGIAALIPVAANNAKTTLELDRSISESTSAAASGFVRSFNDLDTLVIFDKPTSGSTVNVVNEYGYAPANSMRTIRWKTDFQTTHDAPFGPSAVPIVTFGKLETPGYGHMPFDSGLSAGICIDPLGMPDPNLSGPFVPVTDDDSAYDYSRFPYYGERYNTFRPPNERIGTVTAPSGTTPVWPSSPRMWRATLKSPLMGPSALVQRHQLLSAATVRSVFRGSGGISMFPGVEPGDPSSVLMSQTAIGTGLVDVSRQDVAEYTWFATLVPPFLGGTTFRQSIVVVRKRQSPVPTRAGDPLALKRGNYTISDPDENPNAERVTWVGSWNGFTGGAGGEVQLYGSQSISDDITPGEWVMLSRQPHQLAPTVTPTGPAVHRWFRVLRAEPAERISGFTPPGLSSTHDVWRRWVSLAGPDWAFEDGEATPIDDTFCTIVTGAVSVVESEVEIR